jgi:hypothetical protein
MTRHEANHERSDPRIEENHPSLSQNSLLRFQILLNGFYAVAGVGDADGVGLAQFVMHQQFANHSHSKIRIGHVPELTGCQKGLNNAARSLDFLHGRSCA